MIIYKDDWKFYPDAIADVDTSNVTFLRYAALLDKMGVSNNLFHLSLLDRDLVGVNPHDPDLDDRMMEKVIREVNYNMWYTLREVIRSPVQGSANMVPYRLNRLSGPFHWLMMQNISVFVVGPRQSGKSFCADVDHIMYLDIYGRNLPIDVVVSSSALRGSSTDKRTQLRRGIPSYISFRTPDGLKRDRENTDIMECKRLGNVLRCKLASDKYDGALQIGRGLSSPKRQFDEGPHCANIDISMGIAEMGGIEAIRAAIENGTPHGTAITTTPGDITLARGRYMYEIYNSAMPWFEKAYDARNYQHLMNIITSQTGGRSKMVSITMHYHHLGRDDDWLASEIIRSKATPEDIEKDILLIWGKGNLSNPLSKETILRIAASEKEPKYVEVNEYNYICRWYVPKKEIELAIRSGTWALSLDPSELAGRDINGVTLTNVKDMSNLMTCSPSEGNIYTFAKWIFDFLLKYQKVLFIFEAKSSGRSVLDMLVALFVKANINPLKRIYNTAHTDHGVMRKFGRLINADSAAGSIDDYNSLKTYMGINTNQRIRATLYNDIFMNICHDFGHNVIDFELSKQIRELIMVKGRIDHPAGGHDDLVIAWLLVAYVLKTCTNLIYYGINPTQVLRGRWISPEEKADMDKRNVSELSYEEEKAAKYMQVYYERELKKLLDRYGSATDEILQSVIENQIKRIYVKMSNDGVDTTTLDAMLTNIRNDSATLKEVRSHRKQQFLSNVLSGIGG